MMDRDEVMRWVARYERAWRDGDVDAVERLFTDDARYRASPYEDPETGHEAIKAFWLDDEGEVFTMTAERWPWKTASGWRASRCAKGTRRDRSTATSGCCASPTTGEWRTTRSGPTGRASCTGRRRGGGGAVTRGGRC